MAGDWAEPGERQGAGLSHGHLGGDLLASVCRGPELGDQEWQMPPPKDQAGVEKDGDRWEWVVCEPWGGNGVTEGSQGGRWEMWYRWRYLKTETGQVGGLRLWEGWQGAASSLGVPAWRVAPCRMAVWLVIKPFGYNQHRHSKGWHGPLERAEVEGGLPGVMTRQDPGFWTGREHCACGAPGRSILWENMDCFSHPLPQPFGVWGRRSRKMHLRRKWKSPGPGPPPGCQGHRAQQ